MGDRFEVCGVHAAPVNAAVAARTRKITTVTNVIEFQSFGDRTDQFPVGNAVREERAATEAAVPAIQCPLP